MESKEINHEIIDVEAETWRSGCVEIDKPFVEYLGKVACAAAVLAFSFYQLGTGHGDQAYYSSTISLILGTFLGASHASRKKSTA
jgi:hypothetical protein